VISAQFNKACWSLHTAAYPGVPTLVHFADRQEWPFGPHANPPVVVISDGMSDEGKPN